MNGNELQSIRQKLFKTQKQLSGLLGVSLKSVQSFEQGWRSIPPYVERQVLFFLALKIGPLGRFPLCWKVKHCSRQIRESCPAWEFKSGHLCWFINGTICHGKPLKNWSKKIIQCKTCEVFASFKKQGNLHRNGSLIKEKKSRRKVILKKAENF